MLWSDCTQIRYSFRESHPKMGLFLEGATILHGKIAGVLLYSAKSLALLSSLFPTKVTKIVYFPHFKYLGKARGSYRN